MKNSYVDLVTQKIVANETSLGFLAYFVQLMKLNVLSTVVLLNSLMKRLLHFIGNSS